MIIFISVYTLPEERREKEKSVEILRMNDWTQGMVEAGEGVVFSQEFITCYE